jgi:hypothetical protein
MPPKAKPTSRAAKSVTKSKTIKKRSSRPGAVAAVKAATKSLLPRRRRSISSHSGSPESSRPTASPPLQTVLNDERITALELSNRAVTDSLNEVKERFEEFQATLHAVLAGRETGTGNTGPSIAVTRTFEGMNPAEAIQTYLPWLVDEKVTLANVVSCTLDVAHLIKLIPTESDPKVKPTLVWPQVYTLTQPREKPPLSTRALSPTKRCSQITKPSSMH